MSGARHLLCDRSRGVEVNEAQRWSHGAQWTHRCTDDSSWGCDHYRPTKHYCFPPFIKLRCILNIDKCTAFIVELCELWHSHGIPAIKIENTSIPPQISPVHLCSSSCLLPPAPGNHWFFFSPESFAFSRMLHKWKYSVCRFLNLASFT